MSTLHSIYILHAARILIKNAKLNQRPGSIATVEQGTSNIFYQGEIMWISSSESGASKLRPAGKIRPTKTFCQ